jgi:hypothetical protein
MAKRSCGDLFVIFGKWLGLNWNYFQKPRVFMKICGLRVNCGKGRGLNEIVAGISGF